MGGGGGGNTGHGTIYMRLKLDLVVEYSNLNNLLFAWMLVTSMLHQNTIGFFSRVGATKVLWYSQQKLRQRRFKTSRWLRVPCVCFAWVICVQTHKQIVQLRKVV